MSHKLQMYENLRDMLEREVTDIEKKGDLTEQSLDNLYKLTAALKVVDRCIDREEGGQYGMGNNSNMRGGYSGNRGNSYDGIAGAEHYGMSNGMSTMWPTPYELRQKEMSPNERIREGMRREGIYDNSMDGNSYARRGRDGDSDGRYNESHDNFRDNQSRDTYGDSYGYSRDASRKKMVQKLETLMDDTMSENERKAIQDCINKIK